MMDIFEEMLGFIESAEMRGHLRTCADNYTLSECIDIIAAAYAPLARKEAAISRICEAENDTDASKLLSNVRAALAARFEDCENAVFTLTRRENDFYCKDSATTFGAQAGLYFARFDNETTLHADYATCVAVLKDYAALDDHGNPRRDNPIHNGARRVFWFTIEKWGKVDGKMELLIDWTLDTNGDEIYFKSPYYWHDKVRTSHLCYHTFPERVDVHLTTPFAIGDIITIDRRPFADVFHAVVVDIRNCASVAWVNELNEPETELLAFMRGFPFAVSPFYRAARYSGELPEREVPLCALAVELREAPDKAKERWADKRWAKL